MGTGAEPWASGGGSAPGFEKVIGVLRPRFDLKVPFVFCPMNTPVEPGHASKSINISVRGVYFQTMQSVFAGTPRSCLTG